MNVVRVLSSVAARRLAIMRQHLAEPRPSPDRVARAVAKAIKELGAFLGAKEICYSSKTPVAWKKHLAGKQFLRDRK